MVAITPQTNPELYVAEKSDGATLNGDFNFFLKMLTTQLKNQDPTEPMDVSQMTQQIAQYSGVEQQIKTNTMLGALINSNKQSQLSTAVSYIGKEIETMGDTGNLSYVQDGENVYGQAVFSYILPKGVTNAKITITDSTGGAVFQGDGTLKEGRNVVVWDGKNSFNEQQMAAGKYSIKVTGKDSAGKDVAYDARSVGVVNTVESDAEGNITLTVGDVKVKYEDILAVREPTPFYIPDAPEEGDETADNGDDETEES